MPFDPGEVGGLGEAGAGIEAPDDPLRRFGVIEQAAGATLPTDLVLALAQSKTPQQDLHRASVLIARQFDIPATWLLEPLGPEPGVNYYAYKDPMTGGPISFDTARRLIKPFEAKIIQQILGFALAPSNAPAEGSGELAHGMTGAAEAGVTATKVAKAFIALAPVDGHQMDFGQAIAVAMDLARSKINLEKFAANLHFVEENAKGIPPLQRVAVAQMATAQDVQLTAMSQIAYLAAPSEIAGSAVGQGTATTAAQQELVGSTLEKVRESGDPGAKLEAIVSLQQAGILPSSTPLQKALESKETDFNAAADEIVKQMKLDQTAWDNSPFGKLAHAAGYAFNKINGATDAGLYVLNRAAKYTGFAELSAGLIGAGLHPLHPLSGFSEAAAGQFHANFSWDEARDLYYQRDTFGDVIAREWHLPSWSAPIVELTAAWWASPDAIALRAVASAREARLLPGIEDIKSFWTSPIRRIGPLKDVDPATYLIRAARHETDAERYFMRAVMDFRSVLPAQGLDRTLAAAIFDYVKASPRVAEAVLARDIQGLGIAAIAGKAGLGPLAESVDRLQRELDLFHETNSLEALKAADTPEAIAKVDHFGEVQAQHGLLSDWNSYLLQNAERIHELPKFSSPVRQAIEAVSELPTGPAGLRGLTGATIGGAAGSLLGPVGTLAGAGIGGLLARAAKEGRLGDSGAWKGISALFNSAPEIRGQQFVVNIEGDPAADLVSVLRRTRVLSDEQIGQAQLEMAAAASPLNPAREYAVDGVIQRWNKIALEQIDALDNIPAEAAAEFKKVAGGMFKPGEAFGVTTPESELVLPTIYKRPLYPSQLKNEYTFIDPVHYRRGIAESMGTVRKMRNSMLRAFGGHVPELQLGRLAAAHLTLPALMHGASDLFIRDLFLRWWKPLVVLRPAYIVRVVGIEEQARFISTMGLMSRWEAGGNLLANVKRRGLKIAGAEHEVEQGPRLLNWYDRLLRPGEQNLYYHVPGMKLEGLPENTFAVPVRPGNLTDDALAANTTARVALPGEDSVLANLLNHSKGQGALSYDQPHFFDFWLHDLQKQIAQDPVGGLYIKGIRDGKPDAQIIHESFEFLAHDKMGRILATRLMAPGFTDEALHEVIEAGVKVARQYLGKDPELARSLAASALANSVKIEHLKAIPREMAPEAIHGPEIGMLYTAKSHLRTLTDKVHSAILQQPTNALSRHPYFKAWYHRMLTGMLDAAEANGVGLSEGLVRSMEQEARRFALGQVRRVMFDFTRQARLGELLGWVVPFFQPFSEGFVVWSRILQQNPALIPYVQRLWNFGTTWKGFDGKGPAFIHPDPDTGENVISLDWWLGAGITKSIFMNNPVGQLFQLSAPLSAVNFFTQNSAPLDTPLGRISIPIPGFNPEALGLLQSFMDSGWLGISDETKSKLAPWLFQYGPMTLSSVLPTSLRHFVGALWPSLAEVDINRQADKFLDLYQQMGFYPSTERPIPGMSRTEFFNLTPEDRITKWKAYLTERSIEDARQMEVARGFSALFFPTPPQISFPTEGADRDYRELLEYATKQGKGVTEAREWFLAKQPTGIPYVDVRRHPELSLLTVADSIWNPEGAAPTTPGAGSPVSIPSNRYVDQFLRTPAVRQFAKDHPEWVWAIIPHELREADFDPGTYFSQIASGLREIRTPMEKLTAGLVADGWRAFFAIREQWIVESEKLLGEGISTTSITYTTQKNTLYDAPVAGLARQNPDWGTEFYSQERDNIDPNVMAHARALAKVGAFTKTDAGAGLVQYLQLRDSIKGKMEQANITSLQTVYAEDSGLAAAYTDGVDAIIAAHPDFKTAYGIFFRNDLKGIKNYRDRVMDPLPIGDPVRDQIESFDAEYAKALSAIDLFDSPLEKSQAFYNLRNLADSTFTDFADQKFNPLVIKYKSMTPAEQQQAQVNLLQKPYVFFSQYDRTIVLGDASSKTAEQVWRMYDQALIDIQTWQQANPGQSPGPLYDSLSAQFAQLAANDPTVATQLRAANDWTYIARKVIPGAADAADPANAYWTTFLDAVSKVQAIVVANDLHGDTDFGERKAAYVGLKQQLRSYLDLLFESSPIFKQEYDTLNAQLSDGVFDSIVPDVFYPLGGPAYVSAAA